MFNAYMTVGHDRMRKGTFDEALLSFRHAFRHATSPDEKASALQMQGVVQRLDGRLSASQKTLERARATTNNIVLKARITRDLGMTYLDQSKYTPARDALRGSYVILARNHEPIEAAMSKGFYGRAVFLSGWRREGITLLCEADQLLSGGDNRDYELNNLIWLMRMSFTDRFINVRRAVRLIRQTGQSMRWRELVVIIIGGNWLHIHLHRLYGLLRRHG